MAATQEQLPPVVCVCVCVCVCVWARAESSSGCHSRAATTS